MNKGKQRRRQRGRWLNKERFLIILAAAIVAPLLAAFFVVQELQHARQTKPPDPRALPDPAVNTWQQFRPVFNLGSELMQKGKYMEAVKCFRFCMAKAPKRSLPWIGSVLLLGVIAEQVDAPEQADKYYSLYCREACPMVLEARTRLAHGWRPVREQEEARRASPGGKL